MIESERAAIATKSKLSLALAGVILAAIGVASPIVWDWWSKHAQLSLHISSVTTIVSQSNQIQRLEFYYAGKRVRYLAQVLLRVENSGRTPIAESDVISPMTVVVGTEEVLEARVIRKQPSNLEARITSAGNKVVLSLPLLNPGESIDLTVLTTASDPDISAVARIKGISQVTVVRTEKGGPTESDSVIAVIAIALLGIISIVLVFVGTSHILSRRALIRQARNRALEILSAASLAEARRQQFSIISLLSGERINEIRSSIDKAKWPLDEPGKTAFASDVERTLKKEIDYPFVLVLVLIATGSGYFVIAKMIDLIGSSA